jgi:regulator of RNase E activity RraA
MTPKLLSLLQKVDTPTVCNAIEVAQGKRGFSDFTRDTMIPSDPKNKAIVGFARTARIKALEPSEEEVEVLRSRRMAYYKYMSNVEKPSIAVVEDLDFPKAVGAYWGEINCTIHKSFGLSGTLTNGVMRDIDDLPSGYPVIAGSIGPSHAFVRVEEINVEVNIFGLTVKPNDLVHADKHGALVIPYNLVDYLEDAIIKLIDTEKLILQPARKDKLSFSDFEKAWKSFENSRT